MNERRLGETERERLLAAEREQRLQAETLAEVTLALTSLKSRTAVLHEILRQTERLVPHETANIALLEGDEMRVVRWRGYEDFESANMIDDMVRSLSDFPLAAAVVETREPTIVADTREDPRWRFVPGGEWIRSCLIVPIEGQEQVLGLLHLDSDRPGAFSEEHAALLRPLANAAAIALEQARLLEAAERRAAELEAVRQASLSLTAQLELEPVLTSIMASTLSLLPQLRNAHVFLFREGKIVSGTALWKGDPPRHEVIQPRSDGLTYTVARTGEPIVVSDMGDHPLYEDAPSEWKGAIVGLPLKVESRVVGVMNVAYRRPLKVSAADRRVLMLLADQAAIAIKNAQLYEHAQQLEARYRTVSELVSDYAFALRITPEGEVYNEWITEAFVRSTGYQIESGRIVDFPDLVHPDDQPAVREGYTSLLAGNSVTGEVRIVTREGERRWLRLYARPEWDDEEERVVRIVGAAQDVTERRQMEDALRESEAKLRSVIENIPDFLIMASPNGTILFMNTTPGAVTMEEVLRASIYDFLPPGEKERVRQRLKQVVATGEPTSFESMIADDEGRQRWFAARVGAVEQEGVVVALTIVASEITERKMAEEKLHRLAGQRKRLLDVSRNMLSTLDPGAVIRQIRQALRRVLPYETFGLYLLDPERGILHPWIGDDESLHLEPWQKRDIPAGKGILGAVVESGQGELVNDAHLDPRSDYPESFALDQEHLICVPLKTSGEVSGAFIVMRREDPFTEEEFDLAQLFVGYASLAIDNAQLFTRLRSSEEKYRTLFEETKDCVFIISPDGRFLDINPAGVEMFGCSSRQDVLSLNIFEDLLADPDGGQRLRDLLKAHGHARDYEMNVRRRDGQEAFLLVDILPVVEEEEITAYRGFARDITGRKRTEEAMRRTQKLESLGVMAGGVAHDFNNLLTGVLSESHLAARKLPARHDAQKHIDRIVAVAERATDLTGQLLTYSGRDRLETALQNVNQLVTENLSLLEMSVPRSVTIQTALAADLPNVEADPGQMQQVVMNLIMNAAEAYQGRPGTVHVETSTLTVTDESGRVTLSGLPLDAGEYVCLMVQDWGAGMDQETMERIFDPFFTTKFTGRGLGLAAVQGIVRSHKGSIQVESQPGEGTTFRVLLPASPRRAPVPSPEERASFAGATGKLLVVEDDAVIREALDELLGIQGFSVLLAEHGRAGLELFQEHQDVQLVLLDLTMPVMSGSEAFREMRRLRPDVPVILLSGYSEYDAMRAIEDAPLTTFVKKPFRIDELVQVIHRMLA
ncbi:MAG: GAF domain-containing protein [Candidatus Promineifilaceae bacterium]|nr:GAF domain-containing protein [Candidatus Promineifilaceae bacterium]